MKRFFAVILSFLICACFFTACSKNKEVIDENDIIKPTEAVDVEKLKPDEEFAGDFKSKDCTAHIEKNGEGEMTVTIKSAVKDGVCTEWKMSGFFGDKSYRIIYDNCLKATVKYSKDGKEKSRQNEYENGSGIIQFSDGDKFSWKICF